MKIKKPLGYYDYTVVLTYMGMLSSFTGILFSINEQFLNAIVCLILAGLCDMFDGTVASTKERDLKEKQFGIQIDSLSDLISFGVMPALFVFMICKKTAVSAALSGFFVLAALIRLAYYNVNEEERQNITDDKRAFFQGVPVTTVAVLLPMVFVLNSNSERKSLVPYLIMLVVCGIGFISPIEVKKPGLTGKICLILVGILEILGIFFLGWDIV